MFVCEFCGYATQRHNDHKKHVESIHKGVQFNCELCSAMFRWGRSLRRHVKDKHENGRKEELKKKLKKEEREDDGEVLTDVMGSDQNEEMLERSMQMEYIDEETLKKRMLSEYGEKKRKIELGGRILNIAYENNINVGLLEGVDKEALNMYLEYSCM